MGDTGNVFKEMKKEFKAASDGRRVRAGREFPAAAALAAEAGLTLTRLDGKHYRLSLRGPKGCIWLKDLYPGNQRIYAPNPERRGPFLRMPEDLDEWTLIDVVEAAVKAIRRPVANSGNRRE